jgi:Ca2+-binding RTX toxin-like protein
VRVDLGAGTAAGGDAEGDTFAGIEAVGGSIGDDTLIGSTEDDILLGYDGADLLEGAAGNDVLDGEFGADTLRGGEGNDELDDIDGANLLDGGNGDDLIGGSLQDDTILGGDGDDVVRFIDGADSIDGGNGADAVDFGHLGPSAGIFVSEGGVAGAGAAEWTSIERFFGGAGNDSADFAATADVTLDGRDGDDLLVAYDGADSLIGGAGNDQLEGRDADDTLAGGIGDDRVLGGLGDDLVLGEGGADTLEGEAGADTLISGNTNDRLFGGNDDDLLIARGGNNTASGGDGDDLVRIGGTPVGGDTLDGGAGADTLQAQSGFYRITNTADVYTLEYLGNDSTGPALSTSSFSGFEAFFTQGGPFDLSTITDTESEIVAVCFAAGTRIATPAGEVPIEALRPGDALLTADGTTEPVLFLGRRHVVLAGHAAAAEMAPVRIAAGALGEGLPRCDLVVSPDHCLLLDGALVPARLLVNGTTITRDTQRAEVTWFHLELPRHAAILAEGAAAESWLDTGNRAWFANAPVALLRVEGNLDAAGTGWDATRACAPLVHGGPRLAAIRARLDAMPVPRHARRQRRP